MDLEKRAILTLLYTWVFIAIFLKVNSYVLSEAPEKPYMAFVGIAWTIVAFSFHDVMAGFIMGNEGILVRPAISLIKEKLKMK